MADEQPVLKTRFIGYTQHVSRHPLAPMDMVYECEEPVRSRIPLDAKIAGLLILVGWGFLIVRAIVWVAAGNPIFPVN